MTRRVRFLPIDGARVEEIDPRSAAANEPPIRGNPPRGSAGRRRPESKETAMPQAESLLGQGGDRVQDVLKSADKEFQRIQRRVQTRRRTIERRLETQRKSLEKSFEKQAKSIEKTAQKQFKQLRKNDLVKRAETFGKDVQAQLESGLESFLGAFQVATKADVQRIDRKLNRINRKLKELEATPSSRTTSQA